MGVLRPLDLTSKNVRSMINICKVRPTTTHKKTCYIYNKGARFNKDEIMYEFDQDKLNENFETIMYMAGQLMDARNPEHKLTFDNLGYTYEGKIWISNEGLQDDRNDIYDLIALLQEAESFDKQNAILPLIAGQRYWDFVPTYLKPTLSRNDPNYVDPRKKSTGVEPYDN